jgi:site-specific recombinase XerD
VIFKSAKYAGYVAITAGSKLKGEHLMKHANINDIPTYLKPAAQEAGIGKIGWHTFRRSYATLLHNSGTTLAVQKELLRHADIRTTMNIYTQAVSSAKRDASSKVVDTLWRK